MAFTDTFQTSPNVRSTITQAGMLDRVRGDIGLRGNNLITDSDIIAWSNEAQTLIAQELRWWRKVGTIDATAGQAEYDFPTGIIALEECWHNQLPLRFLQLQDLASGYSYWRRQGDGTPLFVYVRGNSGFGLTPTPGTTIVNGIFLVMTSLPPLTAAGSDTYYIPYGGERALISYAKLKAAEKDAAGEGSRRLQIYAKAWEDDLMALRRAVESISENEVTILGADVMPETGMWNRWFGFDPMTKAAGPP